MKRKWLWWIPFALLVVFAAIGLYRQYRDIDPAEWVLARAVSSYVQVTEADALRILDEHRLALEHAAAHNGDLPLPDLSFSEDILDVQVVSGAVCFLLEESGTHAVYLVRDAAPGDLFALDGADVYNAVHIRTPLFGSWIYACDAYDPLSVSEEIIERFPGALDDAQRSRLDPDWLSSPLLLLTDKGSAPQPVRDAAAYAQSKYAITVVYRTVDGGRFFGVYDPKTMAILAVADA